MLLVLAVAVSMAAAGCSKEGASDGKGAANGDTPAPEVTVTAEVAATPEVFEEQPAEIAEVTYSRVSVHDPSIVKANGTYYLFGSHMAWAKSEDLMNWTYFTNNINSDYASIFGNLWEDYCKTPSNPNVKGNLWAPDVIYNKAMGKYCMYMSVNGSDYNSAIVLLTAEDIEGPYTYVGPVVFSGFNTSDHPAEKTDVYQVLGEGADLSRYQSTMNTKLNAIDPCVRYDEDGNLWMSFGSWFGGLYMLKLDNATGLRDYSRTYPTVENESDQYYGCKIAGGWGVSGEGSYVNKFGDHYYLFVSYGGLTAQGGYQMRVFRSENIYGPYVDQNGEKAIYTKSQNNLSSKIGIRIMGSYKFSGNAYTNVAQGHNSTFMDDDGKMYMVFHTRFAQGERSSNSEYHEVHVHQMFLNEDGWLVAAPYEYSGETISDTGYDKKEVVGEYEFITINPTMFYQVLMKKEIGVNPIKHITLYSDGSVKGDLSAAWTYQEGSANMSITIDNVEYKGVFLKQANESDHKIVMTFTVLGGNICAMGSKQ